MEFVFPAVVAFFLAWFAHDYFTRFDRAAEAMDHQFKRGNLPVIRKPMPGNYKLHKAYLKWQTEARRLGFGKLGEIYAETNDNGFVKDSVILVMVNPESTSILAYSRHIIGTQIVLQTEMETSCSDGRFLYSSNNPLIYHLKSPDRILVNKVTDSDLTRFVESHEKFISAFRSGGFLKYDSIERVEEAMDIQQALRDEVIKTKEFPVDEEEMALMTTSSNRNGVRKLYEKLRAIRKKRG